MNFTKIHLNIYKLENKTSKIDTKKSIDSFHLNKKKVAEGSFLF